MLFLLVLLLVSGWSVEPLAAAAAVSVLPVAAFAGARIRAPAPVRASAGCALAGAGVLALAVLPGAEPAWIVAPQLLAGAGMGMALPALAGGLLPERTPGQAAWLLSIRHAGITLALVLIAPIAASQLDSAVADVRERGAALILDARLPPLDKIQLAGPLVADLDPVNPRDALREALDEQAPRFADDAEHRREYAELTERADETLVAGVEDAFRIAFVIAGALALVGAFAVLPREPRNRTIALAAIAGALVLPAMHAVARPEIAPERVAIADPCSPRDLPATGGIDGIVQDAALVALDRAACRFGSSREELALALADPDDARAYRARARGRPALGRRPARAARHQPGLSSQRSGTHGRGVERRAQLLVAAERALEQPPLAADEDRGAANGQGSSTKRRRRASTRGRRRRRGRRPSMRSFDRPTRPDRRGRPARRRSAPTGASPRRPPPARPPASTRCRSRASARAGRAPAAGGGCGRPPRDRAPR